MVLLLKIAFPMSEIESLWNDLISAHNVSFKLVHSVIPLNIFLEVHSIKNNDLQKLIS